MSFASRFRSRTMLHTFLSVFIVFLIVYGIEGFGKISLNVSWLRQNSLRLSLRIGISPEEIFARVNDSFKISCSVPRANGELNFYDEDNVVPDSYIKVFPSPESIFYVCSTLRCLSFSLSELTTLTSK